MSSNLVGKKPNGMYFHTLILAVSTWSYVERVEKNSCPTPKQKQRKVANQKRYRRLLLSSENSKTENPT